MNIRELKDSIYEELSKVALAIANSRRMEILDILAQGSFSVEDIAKHTEMSLANTSRHLQILKNARLVSSDKRGNYVFYKLVDEKVLEVWESVRELGITYNAEVKNLISEYRNGDNSLSPKGLEELINRVEAGEVLLLDVNSEDDYNRSHLHNALSMPLEQLKERLNELPKDVEIVAYCKGKLCILSDEAVAILKANGYSARKLVRILPQWMEAM